MRIPIHPVFFSVRSVGSVVVFLSLKESSPQDSFQNGDLVFHKEFGIGHIRGVSESSAGLTYQIYFTKEKKERSLVAQYAQLNRL
jgi:DNA helicase-2/ATP-dependent DNA helicase PcrA